MESTEEATAVGRTDDDNGLANGNKPGDDEKLLALLMVWMRGVRESTQQ